MNLSIELFIHVFLFVVTRKFTIEKSISKRVECHGGASFTEDLTNSTDDFDVENTLSYIR